MRLENLLQVVAITKACSTLTRHQRLFQVRRCARDRGAQRLMGIREG